MAAHSAQNSQAKCPEVGHDVKVSNLWTLRDFWEWLCPGYTDRNTRSYAIANAAFASYAGIMHLRDFKMELEAGSTAENPCVGLWAKPYMTTESYTYLGALISRKSFDVVTQKRSPPQQHRDVSSQKTTRETVVLEKLKTVSKSKSADQFSPERLADAMAMCERKWVHFQGSEGKLEPDMLLLPHELAAKMSTQSVQSMQSASSSSSVSKGQKKTQKGL